MKMTAPELGTVTVVSPLTIHTDGDPTTDVFPAFYVGAVPTVNARVRWTLESGILIVYVLTAT